MKTRNVIFGMLIIIASFYLSDLEIPSLTGETVKIDAVVYDNGEVLDVVFCPRDNCSEKLADFILSAQESVYCAFFDLDLENVKDALDEVDAKLIVDSDNYDLVSDLDIEIKEDKRSAFMHNKFCIIDSSKIISGSMNPTVNGDVKNNNNLIIIRSDVLASNYEDEFFEMWNGVFGKGSNVKSPIIKFEDFKVENYFCPEDCISQIYSTNKGNAIYKIIDLLRNAEHTIYFMTFSFTHSEIANAILLRNLEGYIDIKGIFESRGSGSQYSKYKLMEYQGIDVIKDKNPATMHHKVFIIDNRTVITGSFNPSKNAQTNNDENILIIHDRDIAAKYLEEFTGLWTAWSDI